MVFLSLPEFLQLVRIAVVVFSPQHAVKSEEILLALVGAWRIKSSCVHVMFAPHHRVEAD